MADQQQVEQVPADRPSGTSSSALRFSLWNLIVVLAMTAVLVRAATATGMSPVFWKWTGFMLILSWAFVGLLGSRKVRSTVPAVLLGVLLLLGVLQSDLPVGPGVVFAGLLLASSVIVLVRDITRRSTLVRICLGSGAATLVLGMLVSLPAVYRIYRLRSTYPVVSMTERLDYERKLDREKLPVVRPTNRFTRGQFTQQQLEWQLRWTDYYDRSAALSELWSSEALASASLEGFLLRTPVVDFEHLPTPPLQNIAVSDVDAKSSSAGANSWSLAHNAVSPQGSPWHALHWGCLVDFVDPLGYGIHLGDRIASPRKSHRVIGFVEHAFHYHPLWTARTRWELMPYELVRLELISMLRFDQPRAYQLEHLPRMDQLRLPDVRHRPLDDFERQAVKRLKQGEWAVVQLSAGARHVRLLGAIPALPGCLECHQVPQGTLLGAFSYELRMKEGASGASPPAQ